jgi:hypothetical protein
MLEKFLGIEALFLAGAEYTRQNGVGLGASVGADAAADLADHHGWAQFALGRVVGQGEGVRIRATRPNGTLSPCFSSAAIPKAFGPTLAPLPQRVRVGAGASAGV